MTQWNYYYPQEANQRATVALWLGILSFVLCWITGVPAFFLGLQARKQILSQPGRYNNMSTATAAIILGSISVGTLALGLVGVVLMGALGGVALGLH